MLRRSILVGVSLAYLISLVSGYFVARVIAQKSYDHYVAPTFEAMDRLELDQARRAFQEGGQKALTDYMASLDQAFGGKHFLLSKDGLDLTNGESRAALLPAAPASRFRGYVHGVLHLAQLSDDGQFWFAVLGTTNETGPATWPYFALWIIVTTGLLLFSLFYLVFPLRHIRDALSSFGNGQMGMRVISRRKDEIGQVAATFNAMAERVEQSFRTERSLLQDISHELRAPLARLTLAVHLAKQERDDELLRQIEANTKKLAALVGEITEFHQRWSTVENSVPLETVDLEQVVKDVVRDSTLEAASRSVTIELDSVPVTLRNAKPDLIGRVLENVLRNAIIHSPTGSRIQVQISRNQDDATVTVRDFGAGVAPDQIERIFDPFYREEKATDERSGLGLGLSIARRGVQWHGGTLQAENVSPGLRLIASFPLNDNANGRV
ncbi:MAG TPA: HAMP domain-containing sensor histidine kinase [Pseudacidobacterium sp.]|nr:HAMP domain-containing sensor histidine kinase [Pseudacidobacterium sp.]